jgi:tetratricopeptide (TPR) repeat protein
MGGGLKSHIRSKRSSMHGLAIVLAMAWLVWEPARLQGAAEDWQLRIRQLVQQQDLASALVVAEARLGEHPEDLEARGWRARLLAWTNRWNESEIEYQAVLQSAPHDTDILVGLADLLSWQGRRAEAIAYLNQASVLDAGRNDVHLRRGRLLHALGRQAEAGAAYALVFSLKGLFVGMEDGLARSATEFFRQDYESQPLASFSAVAGSLGIYGRVGHTAIRWNVSNSSQPEVPEFRLRGYLQTGSGINYAVRF